MSDTKTRVSSSRMVHEREPLAGEKHNPGFHARAVQRAADRKRKLDDFKRKLMARQGVERE